MTTTFDTSGAVPLPHPTPADPAGKWASDPVQWPDLSPFTQGYIEALFASQVVGEAHVGCLETAEGRLFQIAFSDLAPETLARIIADCEAFEPSPNTIEHGRLVWKHRQRGEYASRRPLTVQLGDDGKVRFAKATGEGA